MTRTRMRMRRPCMCVRTGGKAAGRKEGRTGEREGRKGKARGKRVGSRADGGKAGTGDNTIRLEA